MRPFRIGPAPRAEHVHRDDGSAEGQKDRAKEGHEPGTGQEPPQVGEDLGPAEPLHEQHWLARDVQQRGRDRGAKDRDPVVERRAGKTVVIGKDHLRADQKPPNAHQRRERSYLSLLAVDKDVQTDHHEQQGDVLFGDHGQGDQQEVEPVATCLVKVEGKEEKTGRQGDGVKVRQVGPLHGWGQEIGRREDQAGKPTAQMVSGQPEGRQGAQSDDHRLQDEQRHRAIVDQVKERDGGQEELGVVGQEGVGAAELSQGQVNWSVLKGREAHKSPVQRVPHHLVCVAQVHRVGLEGLVAQDREPREQHDIEQDQAIHQTREKESAVPASGEKPSLVAIVPFYLGADPFPEWPILFSYGVVCAEAAFGQRYPPIQEPSRAPIPSLRGTESPCPVGWHGQSPGKRPGS